ncbi:unnamed protein product [Brassica napus]|uniref:(rape) hypothetical protein n=1 Tax=Brassica napus TaxID=3708 RepID=A0A816I6X8_BRANA|nr:unnamed protein product [Brassica napus]
MKKRKSWRCKMGFQTDVKHVAHIGSEVTTTPSWMNDFKPQEHEKGQTGEKELLPTNTNEKPKQKPRRKPGPDASPNHNRSPSSGNAASSVKQSRHNRSKHGSMDSVKDTEASTNHILPDGSAPPRKAASRPRKLKGSIGGEASMKKSSKGKPPESSVDDTSNDII